MPPKLAVEASPSSPPPSRPSSRFGGSAGLLLLSIAFHLVYLGSIFDIYFKSPVTKGVGERYGVDALTSGQGAATEVQKEGLAKRVVLIVGELLRSSVGPAQRLGKLTVFLRCCRGWPSCRQALPNLPFPAVHLLGAVTFASHWTTARSRRHFWPWRRRTRADYYHPCPVHSRAHPERKGRVGSFAHEGADRE